MTPRLVIPMSLLLSSCAVAVFGGNQRLRCDTFSSLNVTDAQLFIRPLSEADFDPQQVGLGSATCIAEISHDVAGPRSATTLSTDDGILGVSSAEDVQVYAAGPVSYAGEWTQAIDNPYLDTPEVNAAGFRTGSVSFAADQGVLTVDIPDATVRLPEEEGFATSEYVSAAVIAATELRAEYLPATLTAAVSGEIVSLAGTSIGEAAIEGQGTEATRLAVYVEAEEIGNLDIVATSTEAQVMIGGSGSLMSLGTLSISSDSDITLYLPPDTYDVTTTGTVSAQDTTIVNSATGAVGAITLSAPNGLIRIFDREQYGGSWPP